MSDQSTVPPLNDESLEIKMVSLALKQAQKQLEEGTASSQIITHFLRLGSLRAQAELEQLQLQNRLLEEKIQSEKIGQKILEMVDDVKRALKSYAYVPPGADDVDIF